MTTTDDVQRRITGYWDRHAPKYQEFQESRLDNPAYDGAWRRVWAEALPQAPSRVLDIGTGTGHAAITIAELGHDVTGIDIAPGMISLAGENARRRGLDVRFELGDAVHPEVAGAPFDAVVSRYLLWTLREVDTALANWRGIVRPGGVIAVVDAPWHPGGANYTPEQLQDDAYGEPTVAALALAHADTIEAWRERIEAAGLTDVQVRPLDEIAELDARFGVAPGHEPTLQHVIVARAPQIEAG